MNLSLSQIRSVTQGAMRIWEEDGGIRFSRFTEEEAAMYASTGFATKSRHTAGIQMEFDTDAAAVSLSVSVQIPSSRNFFAFEIFKDGERIGIIRNFEDADEKTEYIAGKYPAGDFEGTFPLGEGTKRVRIVFPYTVYPLLHSVALLDASVFTPVVRTKKILMYGDSITQGYDSLYPSQTYAARIGDMFGAHILNKGIGGERFNAELASYRNDFAPDFITSAYGTNDWFRLPRDILCDTCRAYHDTLAKQYPDTPIFVLAPTWRADWETETEFGSFISLADFIKEVTDGYDNLHFIPGWDLVPHDPEYFGDKRLHPTSEGFAHYADNLRKELLKYGV
ncbi:MAG: hypothetical protein E7662_09905 [Ruminococcaceae bacterium]|nr:hypothetical protein [Oscillospiraceae bacterium]